MKGIIERFKKIRREEGGFTLVEGLVVTLMMSVLAIMCMNIVTSSSQVANAFNQKQMSVNQGVVADKVTELYKAAEQYKEDFPDRPLTKQSLVDSGYIEMPESYTWTVARYGLNGSEVCAVGFSTTEQTEKYTDENPAEYSSQYQLTSQGASGCWHRNEQGESVPDWDQVDAFPDTVWAGTSKTEMLSSAG